jgi:hypothetical protein
MGKKIAAEEVQDSDLIEGVCDVLRHRRRRRLSPQEHHRDVKNHRIKPGVVLRLKATTVNKTRFYCRLSCFTTLLWLL